jgi:hypothetical protein
MQALTDAEFDPYFVSETAVAAGELAKRGTKAVVAPMSLSLGLGTKKGGIAVMPALNKLTGEGGMSVLTHLMTCDEFLQPADVDGRFTMFADVKKYLVAAFAKAGVKPWVRAARPDGSRVANVTATVHKVPGGPGAFLVTVLRPPVGAKDVVGADGVIRSVPDATGGKEVETLSVDVSALGNLKVYDMRKGALLQAADGKITIEMQAGDGYPLALLPYAIDGIKVASDVKNGALSVEWELASAAKEFATQVARVEVTDAATGRVLPHLCANIVTGPNGKGSVALPLSEEEQARKFTVKVRDVLSGKAAGN